MTDKGFRSLNLGLRIVGETVLYWEPLTNRPRPAIVLRVLDAKDGVVELWVVGSGPYSRTCAVYGDAPGEGLWTRRPTS